MRMLDYIGLEVSLIIPLTHIYILSVR
jgi:hypothetical protein